MNTREHCHKWTSAQAERWLQPSWARAAGGIDWLCSRPPYRFHCEFLLLRVTAADHHQSQPPSARDWRRAITGNHKALFNINIWLMCYRVVSHTAASKAPLSDVVSSSQSGGRGRCGAWCVTSRRWWWLQLPVISRPITASYRYRIESHLISSQLWTNNNKAGQGR